MASNHRRVETILFGSGHVRRYTQDLPVLFDVWVEYLRDPGARQSMLLEPWGDTAPFKVAAAIGGAPLKPIFNRTFVELEASFDELIKRLLPLTPWYRDALGPLKKGATGSIEAAPTPAQLWDDIAPRHRVGFKRLALLPLIRIAGVLATAREKRGAADTVLERLDRPEGIEGDEKWAAQVLDGWRRAFDGLLARPADRDMIFSISRNRTATLAQMHSVKTVKGDAAQALFSVDCSRLTWAVIDCGIDARHPAFVDQSQPPPPSNASVEDRLKRSRVRETYDFSALRELLLDGEVPATKKKRKLRGLDPHEVMHRIRQGKPVDWELIRPFIQIDHDEDYVPPVDGHGSHVSGILAGNWERGDEGRLRGVCPDLGLIDIRVCRPDGTSNEFVIISALQFIRHMNAHADQMAVHGINMSLSLLHDAANFACGRTPICMEAERTVRTGVVIVTAAGNRGHRRLLDETETAFEQYLPISVTDPGNAEAVITVGATHRMEPHNYGVSYFSSRGPTGDGRAKPDLVAPGEKIYAPTLNDEGVRLDGTSMAAPHVSGAAAMLMARHSELIGQPERIKTILCRTATDLGRERYFQGHGLLDILRAMQSI